MKLRTPRTTSTPFDTGADLDSAWKALTLTVDWIKHAETKAGATLAAAGVSAGVLFNITKDQHFSGPLLATTIVCGALIGLAAMFAGLALIPRLWGKSDPTSLLFYDHVARRFPRRDGPAGYVSELTTALTDRAIAAEAVAAQVWANSHVARRKYVFTTRAMRCLLVGLALLGGVALSRVYC